MPAGAHHGRVQIDRLVVRETGSGSITTAAFALPHGRYTLFVDYDPMAAARSLAITDGTGRGLQVSDAGGRSAPLVQHELHAGSYRLRIDAATATCSWMAQLVLNAMLSDDAPPPSWESVLPRPESVTVRGDRSRQFRITRTGHYAPAWTRGIGAYSLDLRAADGHAVHLGAQDAGGDRREGFVFLGAGDWTAEMTTGSDWHLVITPVLGPIGGGAHGF